MNGRKGWNGIVDMSSISSSFNFVWNIVGETDETEGVVSINDIVVLETREVNTGKSFKRVERRNESTFTCDKRSLSNCERR